MTIYYKCIAAVENPCGVPLSDDRYIVERMYLGTGGQIMVEQEIAVPGSRRPDLFGETVSDRRVFSKQLSKQEALEWLDRKGIPYPSDLVA